MEYDTFLHNEFLHAWLRIMHVCKIWRSVVLSTRELWVRITPTSLDYVRFAAARCSTLPISLRMERPTRPDVHPVMACDGSIDAVDAMCALLPRIRHLDFVTTGPVKEYLRSGGLGTRTRVVIAGELEELNFLSRMLYSEPSDEMDAVLSTMNLPKLSTLHFSCFSNFGFTPRPLLQPTLTTLTLFSHTPSIQPRLLAQMLQNLSRLQNLEITTFLDPDRLRSPYQVIEIANLTSLKRLRLQDKDATSISSAQLLCHLRFPASTCVELHIAYATWVRRNLFLDAIFGGLGLVRDAVPRYPPLACPQALVIDVSESQRGPEHRFFLWADDRRYDLDTLRTASSNAMLTVALTSPGVDRHTVVPDFLKRLSKTHFVSLAVRTPLDKQAWQCDLSEATQLERLFIEQDEVAYALLEALSEPLPEKTDSASPSCEPRIPRYLFPNLQELELSAIHWRRHYGAEQDGDLLPLALTCLKRRTQRGMGLSLHKATHAFQIDFERRPPVSQPCGDTMCGGLTLQRCKRAAYV